MDALVITPGAPAPKSKEEQAALKAGDYLTPGEDVLKDVPDALRQSLAAYEEHEEARRAVEVARENRAQCMGRIAKLSEAKRQLEEEVKEAAIAQAMGRGSEEEVSALNESLAEAVRELDAEAARLSICEEAENRLSVEYKRVVRSLKVKVGLEYYARFEEAVRELKAAHAQYVKLFKSVESIRGGAIGRGVYAGEIPAYLKPNQPTW